MPRSVRCPNSNPCAHVEECGNPMNSNDLFDALDAASALIHTASAERMRFHDESRALQREVEGLNATIEERRRLAAECAEESHAFAIEIKKLRDAREAATRRTTSQADDDLQQLREEDAREVAATEVTIFDLETSLADEKKRLSLTMAEADGAAQDVARLERRLQGATRCNRQ
eukprot:Polyplicarium_translucidae@DN1463_c0_g1_i1.p1